MTHTAGRLHFVRVPECSCRRAACRHKRESPPFASPPLVPPAYLGHDHGHADRAENVNEGYGTTF